MSENNVIPEPEEVKEKEICIFCGSPLNGKPEHKFCLDAAIETAIVREKALREPSKEELERNV